MCDVVRRRESVRQARLAKPSRLRWLSGPNRGKFNWLGAWQEFEIHFRSGPIQGPDDLEGEEPRLKQLFHLAMLARGIYLSPRGTLALSLPMGEVETDALLAAVDAFVEDYGPLLPRAAPADALGPGPTAPGPDACLDSRPRIQPRSGLDCSENQGRAIPRSTETRCERTDARN